MKTNFQFILVLAALLAGLHSASAQTTVVTYQGRLEDAGSPAGGQYDLRFALFNTSNGMVQVGNTITNASVAVSKGCSPRR